jgi:MraZ protein
MPSGAPDHFVVRRDIFENCLVLYTIDDWNRQLEKIRSRINPYRREHNVFLRNFFKGTAELSLDSNNRLLFPKRLLDLAGITRDVVLAGQDGRIEVWDASVYEKTDIASDDFAALAEKLLGDRLNDQEL